MADFDFVQGADLAAGGSGTTSDQAFSGDVTAGNLIVVGLSRDGGGNTVTVTKQAGTATVGTIARAVQLDSGQHVELWWGMVTGTGSLTIRATYNSAQNNHRLGILEFVGPASGVSISGTPSSNANASTTTPTSGNTTPAANGALLVGCMTPTAAGVTPTAGGSFTLRTTNGIDGFNTESFVQTTAAAIAATWSITPADPANCLVAAFQATAAGGTVTGTGAVTLGAITVAGTAERTVTGTGAVTLGAIEVAGTGAVSGEVSGTGAITLGPIAVAGTAEREITDVGGAIELTLPAITVAGEGTAGADLVTGTGAIALGAVTVSGTAERQIPGAGAITLGSLTVAGTGTRATDATGAIALGALQVSGQALLSITGTGAITLGAIQVSGFDVAPVVDQSVTGGGFIYAYEREVARRRRERKKRLEREEEAERIEEETTREIARLLREQEAKDARRAELQRLSELVDTYARRNTEATLNERVEKAIQKAATKQTVWSLYALERELKRAQEEEEFMLSALRFMVDYD